MRAAQTRPGAAHGAVALHWLRRRGWAAYLRSHACRRQLVGKEFPIEAKVFFFELGENPRGRFLRISESGAG